MKTSNEKGGKFVSVASQVKYLNAIVVFTCCVCLQTICFAGNIGLSWDPSSGANVAGYKIYYSSDSSTLPFIGTGAIEGSSPVDVHSLTTSTLTGLDPNKTYAFAITAYDNTGLESDYSNIISVAEAIAPTVSITSPASSGTVSGAVSVNVSASDNVNVSKVELYVNDLLQSSDTTTPYVLAWNTTSLANGSYNLIAKAYDPSGNVGQSSVVAVSVNNTTVADTTAPVVALTSPLNGAIVSGTVTVSATATDNMAVSKVELYENSVIVAIINAAPYDYSWNTTSLANGSHTLISKAYDAAGNVGQSSAVSVTVNNTVADTTAPSVSVSAPVANSTVSGTVLVAAAVSDNVGVVKVEYYVNGSLHRTVTAAPFSYNVPTTIADNATYSLYAKAYDAAGNAGQSSTTSFTVYNSVADTTAPTVSISSPVVNSTVSGTVNIAATASDNVGVSKVEFYVNGALKATDTTAPYSYSWNTAAVANGAYSITAKAYDAAGNVKLSSATSLTVKNSVADTTPPTVSISSPVANSTVKGNVLVAATVSDNVGVVKVEYYVNGSLHRTVTTAPFSYNVPTTVADNASYSMYAKAYDKAGNVKQSVTIKFTVKN